MYTVTNCDGTHSVSMLNGLVVSMTTFRLSIHSIVTSRYAQMLPLGFLSEDFLIFSGIPLLLVCTVPVRVVLFLARYIASSGLV